MEQTLNALELDVNRMVFDDIKLSERGSKSVDVSLGEQNGAFPEYLVGVKQNSRYGWSKFVDKSNPDKAGGKETMALTLKGDSDVLAFAKVLKDMDDRLVREALKNKLAWFQDDDLNERDIRKGMTPLVKLAMDRLTNKPTDKYPATVKLKFARNMSLWDHEGNKLECRTEEERKKLLVQGCNVIPVFRISSVWFMGKFQFGYTLEAVQMVVFPNAQQGCMVPAMKRPAEDADEEDYEDTERETSPSKRSKSSAVPVAP